MRWADFSEFSYGYAITDNILHGGLPYTPHAPVFPSLFAEGTAGGGYDVQIPLYPVAVFLQFKIPQIMRRRSAKMPQGFTLPYYRMHLRTKQPNQHGLLLDLEAGGELVYYACPEFHTNPALDSFFTHTQVPIETAYFSPWAIGPLDNQAHFVAYQRGDEVGWRFSEPVKLEAPIGAGSFGRKVIAAVGAATSKDPLAFLSELIGKIERAVATVAMKEEEDAELPLESEPRHPKEKLAPSATPQGQGPSDMASQVSEAARRAAYLARVRLDSTLIVTGRNE